MQRIITASKSLFSMRFHFSSQAFLKVLFFIGVICFPSISKAEGWKASLARTTGVKRLLFIRVDSSDKPGAATSQERAKEIMQQVNEFYEANSQGKTQIITDITPSLRLPQTFIWYISQENSSAAIAKDARIAAQNAGYDVKSYQWEIVNSRPLQKNNYGSRAAIAAKGFTLIGSQALGLIAHELGHNYGLGHAHLWKTTDGSVIGEGKSTEYGNPFDVMGNTSRIDAKFHHFTAYAKYFLNWLPDDAVKTITKSGTYRIFAHDLPNASGLRLLKIQKDDKRDYWVEFRQLDTNNFSIMNGALIYWVERKRLRETTLLDMTPGSSEGAEDAPLFIGRTFTDKEANIHITPIGKGGTDPESLDIVVNLGQFQDNKPPTVHLISSSLTAKPNESIAFKTEASDPDGDTLAYSWSTSDGEVAGNVTKAQKSWSAPGKYQVHCVVTDMKGGTGEDTVEITVQ